MAQRTCTITGCGKAHRARGLCVTHYNQQKPAVRHRKVERVCERCGATYLTPRQDGRFCSDICKGQTYSAERLTRCKLPSDHPVIVLTRERRAAEQAAKRAADLPRPHTRHDARECPGCACWFTPLAASAAHMICCSKQCRARVARRRRRALEHNTLNRWRWSDFMRIARRFGYACAYCGSKPGRLDPDHVVPLSRGGDDAVANLLPACPTCNSDKSNLMLVEWSARRATQGKPPRATSWTVGDARYAHLTSVLPSASAAA